MHVCRPVMCYQYITVVLFLQLYASVKLKMEEMQQHMSWIEVQFLKKAVDVLCLCRQTLMFTYVFAFYLKKNNQSIIFEVNHVYWGYQCLVSHGNRFNLSLPFYVVVVTGMLVMPCLLCAFFYAQRCFFKEVQTYNDKFH